MPHIFMAHQKTKNKKKLGGTRNQCVLGARNHPLNFVELRRSGRRLFMIQKGDRRALGVMPKFWWRYGKQRSDSEGPGEMA